MNPSLIDVQPASLPDGEGGLPYAQTITASGGTTPYTFALTAGDQLIDALRQDQTVVAKFARMRQPVHSLRIMHQQPADSEHLQIGSDGYPIGGDGGFNRFD